MGTRKYRFNTEILDTWSSPLDGFYKLNFDDASKGKTSNAGFRGLIRNNVGNNIWIFFRNITHDSNNDEELEGVIEGIGISNKNEFLILVAEGKL